METTHTLCRSQDIKRYRINGQSSTPYLVPKNTLRTIYYAFIQPHVDYGLINWGCADKTALNLIRVSVKKAVRIMAFQEKYNKVNKKYVSTGPLFHKFNILSFDDYCKLTVGKLMWEIGQNLHPAFIHCLFTKASGNIK